MQQINIENPDRYQAGDELEWEGKKLMVIGQFSSGNDFRASNLNYYAINNKGVLGLQEV